MQLLFPIASLAQSNVLLQNTTQTINKEPPLADQPRIKIPDLGDASSGDLSALDEKKLGERIMREIRKDPDYVSNWLLFDYLNQLGGNLVAGARKQKISGADQSGPFAPKFEFFGVRDSSINAFALPGGYIGVHTGLLLMADNESQVASVLGHEIGHVTQKHIARGAGQSATNAVVMLASILLAAVAMRNNPGAAQGLAVGGQALAIQNQLSYSRDAEREADRIGFQILLASGYDVNGMPEFFQKLQQSSGVSDKSMPAYVRTHPLTIDRIADMQDRVRQVNGPRKTNENLDFYLMQSVAKVEQQNRLSEVNDLKEYFDAQTKSTNNIKMMQGYFGLALVDLAQNQLDEAEKVLQKSKEIAIKISASGGPYTRTNIPFEITLVELNLARKNGLEALNHAQQALRLNPNSKAAGIALVKTYYAVGKPKEAIDWLVQKTKYQKDDSSWWGLLAQGYAMQNQQTAYHAAIAEQYVCEGALPAAIQQLEIAKQESRDSNFYQLSEIEARKRQLEQYYRDEIKNNAGAPKEN